MNNTRLLRVLTIIGLSAIISVHASASLINTIAKNASIACFDSTVKSAIQKIIVDANTVNTDLDLIGFQADKCIFNPKNDSIECLNKESKLVFTVELQKLEPLPSTQNEKSYLFSFKTGNENISVIYDIEVTKYLTSQKCEVTKIESHTELP